MKISVVQFAPILGQVEDNIEILKTQFADAWKSDMVVLPELASTGYRFANRQNAFDCAESINNSQYIDFLEGMSAEHGCHIVSGINELSDGNLYNSSVLVSPQGLLGLYRKLHLFANEKNIFTPGDLGAEVYDTDLGKIAMLICFDWMFPELWRHLGVKGAQLICHPCNLVLPYCQQVVPSHAIINRFFVATANRIGTESDLTFTGQSLICDSRGKVLTSASEKSSAVISADINLDDADDKWVTTENHLFYDRRVDVYGQCEG